MKKIYLIPTMQVDEAQAAQMLAESLPIVLDDELNGSEALVKVNNSWDIWGEAE